MKTATIHTDGGARGNPGPAGIGAVLTIGDEKFGFKKYIGKTTNNQAEYQALLLGLEKAKSHDVTDLTCYLDSELVVKQLNREYKVKDADLATQFVKVWNLAQEFTKIRFVHVRREQNKEADKLVNEVLDAQLK